MMYSLSRRLLWISCPRVASHTIYKILRKIGGFDRPNKAQYHETNIELCPKPKVGRYKILGVCRNPYARAVSCWRYARHERIKSYPGLLEATGDDTSLTTFMANFLVPMERCPRELMVKHLHWLKRHEWPHPGYRSCWDWYELSNIKVDVWLHLETMAEQLKEFGIPWTDVKNNANKAGGVKRWFDAEPDAVDLVERWAAPDFEHLGYNRGDIPE